MKSDESNIEPDDIVSEVSEIPELDMEESYEVVGQDTVSKLTPCV